MNILNILIAMLAGALLLAVLFTVFLLILSRYGVRLTFHKRPRSRHVKVATAQTEGERQAKDLSQEELLAIITAAVVEYLGKESEKQFRVISFKRI